MIAQTTTTSHRSFHHPHDTLFKKALQYQVVARDFFSHHLPCEFIQSLDLNSLTFQNDSFIDDQNFQKETDVLYRVNIEGHPGYLYLLAEQQTQVDPWMSYRVMIYVVRIMERHRRLYPKEPLPLIYPLVVYTGDESWKHSLDVRALIGAPKDLIERYFMNAFSLIQTHKMDPKQLQQHVFSSSLSWVLSHTRSPNVISILHKQLLPNLKCLDDQGEIDYLTDLIQYILDHYELDPVVFKQLIKTHFTQTTGEKLMTTAEQFRQQGLEQGLEQGWERGWEQGLKHKHEYALRSAKRLLEFGMPLTDISIAVELSVTDLMPLVEKDEA